MSNPKSETTFRVEFGEGSRLGSAEELMVWAIKALGEIRSPGRKDMPGDAEADYASVRITGRERLLTFFDKDEGSVALGDPRFVLSASGPERTLLYKDIGASDEPAAGTIWEQSADTQLRVEVRGGDKAAVNKVAMALYHKRPRTEDWLRQPVRFDCALAYSDGDFDLQHRGLLQVQTNAPMADELWLAGFPALAEHGVGKAMRSVATIEERTLVATPKKSSKRQPAEPSLMLTSWGRGEYGAPLIEISLLDLADVVDGRISPTAALRAFREALVAAELLQGGAVSDRAATVYSSVKATP